MKTSIAAGDSPDYLCEIDVAPIGGGKPLELKLRRAEYVPDFPGEWQRWLGERMKSTPVIDDAGEQVVNPLTGEPKETEAEALTDEEFYIEQMRIAGATAAECKKLYDAKKFPLGVLRDVYEAWTGASKVSPGESQASDS